MKEKLRCFNIETDDIETINFENGMIEKIAEQYANEYDLKRFELVLNENIITVKDKFTGMYSYMGMKISLQPLEKDISFVVRPTNAPTYDDLQEQIKTLEELCEYAEKNSVLNDQLDRELIKRARLEDRIKKATKYARETLGFLENCFGRDDKEIRACIDIHRRYLEILEGEDNGNVKN